MTRTQHAVPHPDGMTRRPRVLLCINPASGLGRGADAGAEAAARLRSAGVDVEILPVPGCDHRVTGKTSETGVTDVTNATDVTAPGPAERYAAALASRLSADGNRAGEGGAVRPDAVVVVGGDGMVHASVQVVVGTGTPLGLIPAGTGNDFARTLGLGSGRRGHVAEAARRTVEALHRPVHPVDLVRVEVTSPEGAGRRVHHVASCLNVGFDAAVNEMANHLRLRPNGSRYVVAVLAQVATYRPRTLEVVCRGGPEGEHRRRGEVFALMVMNGRFVGAGMEVTPDARVDDGLLDVLSVPRVGPARFLREFPKVFCGGHTHLDLVHLHRAREVEIREAAVPGPRAGSGARTHGQVLHGDGEPLGLLPARISVRPGALALLDYRAPTLEG